jgi:hypothetical protein
LISICNSLASGLFANALERNLITAEAVGQEARDPSDGRQATIVDN